MERSIGSQSAATGDSVDDCRRHARPDAAELLVHQAASSGGLADVRKAALFVSEAAQHAADNAIQISGGYGYTKEYLVEASWRDGRHIHRVLLGSGFRLREDLARNRFSSGGIRTLSAFLSGTLAPLTFFEAG